jgi:hypothetical protein
MAEPQVFYFGAWGGTGHYLWTPDGKTTWDVRLPWKNIDGALAVDPALADPRWRACVTSESQPEGRARLHHLDGWTALAWWDRSCDARFGSNSAIAARGEHSAAEMAELLRRAFPAIWDRITRRFELVLPVEEQRPEPAPPRPMPGDRVAQHRHMAGAEGFPQVEWRETVGEVLAVVTHPEALGGWVALVRWPELKGRHRFEVFDGMDFGEMAGTQRVRVVGGDSVVS